MFVFSGGEWDYVIFSTVRSLPEYKIEQNPTLGWCKHNLGFITDRNQVNVALTRARKGLIIIGIPYSSLTILLIISCFVIRYSKSTLIWIVETHRNLKLNFFNWFSLYELVAMRIICCIGLQRVMCPLMNHVLNAWSHWRNCIISLFICRPSIGYAIYTMFSFVSQILGHVSFLILNVVRSYNRTTFMIAVIPFSIVSEQAHTNKLEFMNIPQYNNRPLHNQI